MELFTFPATPIWRSNVVVFAVIRIILATCKSERKTLLCSRFWMDSYINTVPFSCRRSSSTSIAVSTLNIFCKSLSDTIKPQANLLSRGELRIHVRDGNCHNWNGNYNSCAVSLHRLNTREYILAFIVSKVTLQSFPVIIVICIHWCTQQT